MSYMCHSRGTFTNIKRLKRLKSAIQNVYHNSYLIANKRQLQKFIFVFGICPIVLHGSLQMNEFVCIHIVTYDTHSVLCFLIFLTILIMYFNFPVAYL